MKRNSKASEEDIGTKKKKRVQRYSESKLKEISTIFLSDKKHSNILVDLLDQFHKPTQITASCVSVLEKIFVEILKRSDMTVNDTENIGEAECQYKEWLRGCYEDAWTKLTMCLQKGGPECKLQALNSLFTLLSTEAKFPLIKEKKKKKNKNSFPVNKLKRILQSLSSSLTLNPDVLKRMSEYTEYKDVQCNMWLALNSFLKDSCKQRPNDKSIWNILLVLSGMPKSKKGPDVTLCSLKNGVPEERVVRTAVDSVWKQLAPRQYSCKTQQLLLVVLVEHMMPQMDNSIYLTDYFMDTLNRNECEISMLALQGIFNLVIKHNIEYPDIYGKLYQLFTVEALNAKYKTRLFALADEFLRSTHLPLMLVAAFAKRFSRLLLVSTPPDCLILLTFIANLMIRHPDLRVLSHKPNAKEVEEDPYLEDEKDPRSSCALESQLWEVKLMQQHYSERVAKMATFINNDLPSAEYQLEPLLNLSWTKMIKKDITQLTKKIPQVAENIQDKPLSSKMQEARQKELKLQFSEFNSFFGVVKSSSS